MEKKIKLRNSFNNGFEKYLKFLADTSNYRKVNRRHKGYSICLYLSFLICDVARPREQGYLI